MEILKLTTTIDELGYLHLHIPTQLVATKVNVVVVVNPASSNETNNINYDFSDLIGRLSWQGDPVATQKSLRDEW